MANCFVLKCMLGYLLSCLLFKKRKRCFKNVKYLTMSLWLGENILSYNINFLDLCKICSILLFNPYL